MHSTWFFVLAAYASLATSTITWKLNKESSPTNAQAAAYVLIEAAMGAAADRYNRIAPDIPSQDITVDLVEGVTTADANRGLGRVQFGKDQQYMTEAHALHEISHIIGIGELPAWTNLCVNGRGKWPVTLKLLQGFDGDDAVIGCDNWHFWPYGLNQETEFINDAGDRHVMMVQSFVNEGLQKG